MNTYTAFVMTVLVLCYAVVSGLVKKWYVAPALIFVLVGMTLGPYGFDVLDAGTETSTFTVLAQLALTVILFNQAVELDLVAMVRRRDVTFRLLVIGIPLAIALGVVTVLLVLPVMPLWEAVCLAAIVAPTEVALIDALLDSERVPERLRHTLATESGFYDGFALAALLAALALASEEVDADAGHWVGFLLRTEVLSAAVGIAVGLAAGWVVGRSLKHGWMSDIWAQLATPAVAIVCFQAGEHLHGSGFVTAFAGGLAFAFATRRTGEHPDMHVSEATAKLLELLVFAVLGAYVVIDSWRNAGWRVILFAVLALFVVRLVAVSVALWRSHVPAHDRLFIGWFGPRGISTLVLAVLVVERGAIEQEALITQVAVVTVTLSLVVHSATTWPGIRALERRVASPEPS